MGLEQNVLLIFRMYLCTSETVNKKLESDVFMVLSTK